MAGIKLGDRVKDSITGFEGIAIAKAEYLNGCIAYQVKSPNLNKEGGTIEAEWFDEERLTSVKNGPGGPHDRPPEMHP